MSEALPKCLVLAGPTASGKTEAVHDHTVLEMNDTLVISGIPRTLAIAEEKLLKG